MTYAEKLKDPRWQRKRLEVMQRAGFACELCGETTKTLHVHHLKYVGEPWDAPFETLECLCEDHHQQRHENQLGVNFTTARASVVARFFAALDKAQENGISGTEIVSLMCLGLEARNAEIS